MTDDGGFSSVDGCRDRALWDGGIQGSSPPFTEGPINTAGVLVVTQGAIRYVSVVVPWGLFFDASGSANAIAVGWRENGRPHPQFRLAIASVGAT
jgi:hypothetical protein